MRVIVAPRTKGRHGDGDHRQSEIEVLAELSALHLAQKIALGRPPGRTFDLRVRLPPTRRNSRVSSTRKSLGWTSSGSSPNFVEEYGSPLGQLERSLARRDRAGESSTFVTEELRLKQRVAHRPAVDDDEWPVRPCAFGPDGARKDVLARARLSLQKDRGVGLRDTLQDSEDGAHRQALTDGCSKPGLVTREDLDVADCRTQRDFDLADFEHRTRRNNGLGDARSLHPSAVGRAEVAHFHAVASAGELTVVAGDCVVGEHQVVVGGLANAQEVSHGLGGPLGRAREDDHVDPHLRARGVDRASGDVDVLFDLLARGGLSTVVVVGHHWGTASARSIDVTPPTKVSCFRTMDF